MPTLDASFLVDLLRGREEALAILSDLEEKSAPIFSTPIAALEQYLRAHPSSNP